MKQTDDLQTSGFRIDFYKRLWLVIVRCLDGCEIYGYFHWLSSFSGFEAGA